MIEEKTEVPNLDALALGLKRSVTRQPSHLGYTLLEQIGNYRKHPESRDALRAGIVKNIDRILGR
jgi:hypothetical protein